VRFLFGEILTGGYNLPVETNRSALFGALSGYTPGPIFRRSGNNTEDRLFGAFTILNPVAKLEYI